MTSTGSFTVIRRLQTSGGSDQSRIDMDPLVAMPIAIKLALVLAVALGSASLIIDFDPDTDELPELTGTTCRKTGMGAVAALKRLCFTSNPTVCESPRRRAHRRPNE
jgi:hypothetical protein